MDDDDEFGDLYTDVLRFPTSSSAPAPAPAAPPPPPRSFPSAAASKPLPDPLLSNDDDDNDPISQGASCPKPPVLPPSIPSQTLAPASEEDGDDDWLLGHAPPAVEPPANWDDEDDEVPPEAASRDVPEAGERRVLEEDYGDEARVSEFPTQDAEVAEEAGDGDPFLGGGARESMGIGDLDQAPVIPGLSVGPAPAGPFLDTNGGDVKASRSEDWDTDSEDDLQIVLNDNNHVPLGGERNDRGGDEEDDDEDGEADLVIVTDEDQHHHIPAMEEQDWGEEAIQPAGDGETKEMADVAKGNGPAGTAPAGRIGYSSHGFSMQHHSTYKYIRPGAAPVSGGPSGGAVGPPGQVRPPLPLGFAAGRGRGDWRPAGGRGIPNAPKSFHSFGGPSWSNGSSVRAFGSGLDFTLPAHKTIFDVDIESFEEKPWRHPGVDVSDFFNFGLDEDKWKDYCKQLGQLRLEATMQSKIRVYESGRSEQDYDPDLPPELAAAAGHHGISADNGYHGRADNKQTDFNSQGSGAANIRAPIPTGRAIQVESGYGERQPSIDTRQPRLRDSDAIIEIVLQDSMDDPATNDGALQKPEKDLQGEHYKSAHEFEDERHVTSEHDNRYPHSLSGRKREMDRRGPSAPDEDGILPILLEAHGHYHSNSKSRSPVYSSGSFGGHRDARLPRGTSQGRHSSASGEPSNDVVPSQSAHSKRHDDPQKEKLIDSTEVNQTSEVSPALAVETAGELSIEQKYEHDEKLALADSIDVEGEEITSDFHISSETVCDDNLIYPHKKQKLSSRVEQPAANDTGDEDELRTSHSDNSRAKTGSSKDYQKQRENGEEVMQDGRSRQMGNISKHREGEEYILRRKDDYSRDARQETDRKRIAFKGRENIYHSYGHRDWDPASGHPVRDRSFERPKESSSSIGVRQRRQDSIQSRRVKDEDIKRERSEETELRHRSKVRASNRNDRDEDLHSKKRMDDGDWRGHNRDGTSRQRERDDILMSRRENLDDSYIRRKKDEEVSRRGKADKEDALHGYRGREDSNRRKRERDDDIDYRRREDGPRLRDKAQDHYSSKHKDDSWRHREREDRQQVKQLHENAPTHREREEGWGAVRSGRAIEDKGLCRNGRNKDELKTIGSDKDYQDKERKRYNEQSKRGDRTGEENVSHHKGHGDVHACEKQHNKDERNSRHERLSSHNERPSSASDSQQMYRERHRENTRKGKDSEANEQNNQMLGRRKHEDHNIHQNDKASLKGTNERESSNFSSATISKKDHHQIHEQLKVHQLHDSLTKQGEEDLASDDENQQGSRRGRSKLERWTSHQERDYSAIQNVQTLSSVSVKEDEVMNADVIQVDELAKTEGNSNAGELEPKSGDAGQTVDKIGDERHLDTMAKLKRRSERFRLPMPGEKETTLSKKVENEVRLTQNEAVADTEVKPERPARKRRWTGS